jgi:hypothetical protein
MMSANWITDMLEKRGVAYESLHHRVALTARAQADGKAQVSLGRS